MPRPRPHAVSEKANRRNQRSRDALGQVLRECRRDLQQSLGDGASVSSVRPIVAGLASWAHDQEVPPERLLPVFKEMVADIPAFKTSDPQHRGELMVSLVQMAIEGYYAER